MIEAINALDQTSYGCIILPSQTLTRPLPHLFCSLCLSLVLPSLVPRLPFQLSVACSTGKAERVRFSRTASDGKLEGKPGNEARFSH